ncbi:hypothetical protein [Leucobacter sp.]
MLPPAITGGRLEEAIGIASHLSISDVVVMLREDVMPVDERACDAFIERWLETLPPIERLSAAIETSEFYLLDLVWLPHAEDRSVERVLSAAAEALGQLGKEFGSYPLIAESPDASFDGAFAENYRRIAEDDLVGLVRTLARDASALRHSIESESSSGPG